MGDANPSRELLVQARIAALSRSYARKRPRHFGLATAFGGALGGALGEALATRWQLALGRKGV